MDTGRAQQVAKQNNNKLILGGLGAALVGYYFYKKRQGDVANVGDAASKTGAAAGRALERAGQETGSPGMREEGRGFQAKK